MVAQPCLRGGIDWRLVVVTQQRNRVALDVTAAACRPGVVLNRHPDKRHFTNDEADLALKSELAAPNLPVGRITVPPCRRLEAVTPDQRRTDNEPENRAPVIAAAAIRLAAV